MRVPRDGSGCGDDDLGQFFDDAELLVAVEDVDRREHLDADVVAVAGRVRDRVGWRQLGVPVSIPLLGAPQPDSLGAAVDAAEDQARA
jgi:hypothetical protein